MWLGRVGSSPRFDHQAKSTSYNSRSTYRDARNDGEHIHTHFPRFGTDSEKTNDFRVSLDWSDVEAIIRAFCEMNYPEATRLIRCKNVDSSHRRFCKTSGLKAVEGFCHLDKTSDFLQA